MRFTHAPDINSGDESCGKLKANGRTAIPRVQARAESVRA
jgi:hypothetical protein